MTLHAFIDGASRGNPGESGIGLLVKDADGRRIISVEAYIGRTTNNIAEYTALLALLRRMRKNPPKAGSRLVVHSDSELMVRQLNREYKVKDQHLKKFHQKVLKVLDDIPFEFELKHIPRELNAEADRLANNGIDSKKRIKI
jgi:ribonuclease HI